MTKRGRKKADKLKREPIHKMLDLALDINGMQASQRKITGSHPTAFFYMSGHTGMVEVHIHPCGWAPDKEHGEYDKGMSADARMNGKPFMDECTLSGAVRKLEETKFELMNGRI